MKFLVPKELNCIYLFTLCSVPNKTGEILFLFECFSLLHVLIRNFLFIKFHPTLLFGTPDIFCTWMKQQKKYLNYCPPLKQCTPLNSVPPLNRFPLEWIWKNVVLCSIYLIWESSESHPRVIQESSESHSRIIRQLSDS